MIIKKLRVYYFLLFLVLNLFSSYSQELKEQSILIPTILDTSIRYGKLPNGFTYYIKDVANSDDKIAMRLYVKIGNNSLDPNELEFAHAIEHLAFKCSKDFPENLLNNPSLLNNLGMDQSDIFGQTLSYTTWYRFNIPPNRIDALNKGLQWFKNISDLDLSEDAIIKEKGPIQQEVIFRQGSDLEEFFLKTRLKSLLFPCKMDFSQFFEHNNTYLPSALTNFYNRWYQPDRMGVVLVGKIKNLDFIEKKVKKYFSEIKGIKTTDIWEDCINNYLFSQGGFVSVNRDSEYNSEVEMFLFMRDPNLIFQRGTLKGLERMLIWEILSKIINSRLKESGKLYKSPFSVSAHMPSLHHPALEVRIRTRSNNRKEAIVQTVKTLQQLKLFGLTRDEWVKIKNEQLLKLQKEDTTQSSYWIKQIQEHYSFGEALPAKKNIILQEWLSKLTLEDFNHWCLNNIKSIPDDLGFISPSGETFSEDTVRSWIHQTMTKEITPYSHPNSPKDLINNNVFSNLRKSPYIYKGITTTGAIEIKLENGLKVVLDTISNNTDRFYLHGFRTKGALCFPDKNYFSAINSASIIEDAGVGDLNKFELDRYLKDNTRRLWIRPYVQNNEVGIKGNAAIRDLEKALQLVFLYFTQPKKNRNAFSYWKLEEKNRHQNPSYSIINEDFKTNIKEFLGDNSEVPQGTIRLRGIDQTHLDNAYKIYKQLFGQAEDFTFILSGKMSKNYVLPLLQKYLGNLPNRDNHKCSKPKTTIHSYNKPIYKHFDIKKIGANYQLKSIYYHLKFASGVAKPLNWKDQINLEILGVLMDAKLRTLRFSKEYALYNYQALGSFNKELLFYDFRILLSAIPGELKELRLATKQLVEEIKKEPLNNALFTEVMHRRVYPRYTLERQNHPERRGRQLYGIYRYQEQWVKPTEKEKYVRSITPLNIQKIAQTYLRIENLMEFTYSDKSKINYQP